VQERGAACFKAEALFDKCHASDVVQNDAVRVVVVARKKLVHENMDLEEWLPQNFEASRFVLVLPHDAMLIEGSVAEPGSVLDVCRAILFAGNFEDRPGLVLLH